MANVDSASIMRNRLAAGRRSPLATYRDLTVGDVGTVRFIAWELLTMLIAPLPGGIGFLLRKTLYPRLFASFGKSVIIGRNVTIRHPHRIHIGDNVTVDDGALLDGRGAQGEGMRLEEGVMINRGCMILAKHGDIRVGAHASIGANSVIVSMDGVDIGAKVMFAGGCYISTGAYRVDDAPGPIMDQPAYSDGPVVIGDGAWLGTGTIVLDAARIGAGSVIGAGSLVTDAIADNSIAVGTPAKVRRQRRAGEPTSASATR